jgi:hypothetical protein
MKSLLIATMLGGLLSGSVCAYEVETHAHMTKEALSRSSLPGSTFFIYLGIYGLDGELLLPKQYWDFTSGSEKLRYVDSDNGADPKRFEARVLDQLGVGSGDELHPSGWALRGTIREDDTGAVFGSAITRFKVDNPFDDPYSPSLVRVTNHFFDPVNNLPLNGGLASLISPPPRKAPDWALGAIDAFQPSPAPDSSRANHFSVLDVREAMWRALTGRRFSDDTIVASSATERSQYWATAFRAVGDVLHLVQDMAQPQHTRNDPHAGIPGFGVSKSAYEERVNKRVLATVSPPAPPMLPPIDYGPTCNSQGGYCPVTLNRYSDYFSTRPAPGAYGKGMADYSNAGFFTVGTNLGENNYSSPPNNPFAYTLTDTTGLQGRHIQVMMGTVPDQVFSSQTIKLTAPGPWYEFTSARGMPNHFYMLDENHDDHAALLLPRAVAYSAGLINYMFRGSLEIEPPDEKVYAVEDFSTYALPNAGFKKLKMKIKNSTQLFGGVAQPMDGASSAGTLVAVLSFRRNTCLKLPSLTGVPALDPADPTLQTIIWDESCRSPSLEAQPLAPEIVVSDRVTAPPLDQALQTVVFTFATPLPFDATDVDLQVIYRGPLGTESDAIAIGFEHISEPGFVNFDNNYDCFSNKGTFCKANPTDATCTFSASIKLPFWDATDQPGWRAVASVSNLAAGKYARVAYLSRAANKIDYPDGTSVQVTTNQRFAYDVYMTYPDNTTEFWPAKKPVTAPFKRSRKLLQPDQPVMYAWGDSFGTYENTCGGQTCGAFDWANTCDAIDAQPQSVVVSFP